MITDTKYFPTTGLEKVTKQEKEQALRPCAEVFNHVEICLISTTAMVLLSGVCEVASINCSNAEICAVDGDGSATCTCKSRSACPLDVRPVCGSDGRTYLNACLLEVESGLFGLLSPISRGACGKLQYCRINI